MAPDVKPSRRKYNSPLREDQARQTRSRILDASYRLFADRGYAGTTIAAVAEAAKVSPETVYVAFGSKRGLLEGVIEASIAPEEDPAAQEDALWSDLAELPTARERLAAMVDYSCGILARTAAVHAVIRGAADKESFAVALRRRLMRDRLANQTERLRRYVGENLRKGLSVAEAGERYCALTSPDIYYLLTVELGWTADRHRRWLSELIVAELLGPSSA
jgi:AcrR family transcriptional regulator